MTELLPVAIGISAVVGLFFTGIELHRSRKIAIANAETAIFKDYNEWTWKYDKDTDFASLKKVMNVLEILIKDVKRGLYPFNEYINSFFPVTFHYIHEFEKKYCRETNKTSDDFREDFKKFSKVLIPVFDLYEEKSNEFLNGRERTPDNLEGFRDSDYAKLSKSDLKKLKYKVKYPRRYAVLSSAITPFISLLFPRRPSKKER